MQSFGIPDREVALGSLAEVIGQNTRDLSAVAGAAVQPVLQTLSLAERDLGRVRSTLVRSLAGSARAGRDRLALVGEVLSANLAGRVSAAQADLATGLVALAGEAVPPAPSWSCPVLYSPTEEEQFVTWYWAGAADGRSIARPATRPGGEEYQILIREWPSYAAMRADPELALCLGQGPLPPKPPLPPPRPPIGELVCPQCCCCPCTCAPAPLPPVPPPPPPRPGPTPEPAPLPPLPGLPKLPELVACPGVVGLGGLAVGSPEWCACVDDLKEYFRGFGAAAGPVLLQPLILQAEAAGWLAGGLSRLLGLVGLDFPGANLVEGIADIVRSNLQRFQDLLRQLVGGSGVCAPDLLIGLALARALIKSLESIHLGVDIPIWATISLTIKLGPLEQVIDYLQNHACPVAIPTPEAAVECLLQGTASEQQVRCWLALHGVNLDVWRPVIEARREKLTIQELIEYLRRSGVPEADQVAALTRRGFLRPEEAVARVTLYDELPTTSDFLHFLVRNTYDREYVQQYGLMDGFEEQFWSNYGTALRIKGMDKRWAAEHYAAHWVLPSPTQMQEMVYRLRPGKSGVDNPFTEDDYKRLLVEHDYTGYFRERFKEIVYRVPALTYLRDMHRNFLLSDEEMGSYHQDLGYRESDSDKFVAIDRLFRDRNRATRSGGWTPRAAALAAAAGALARERLDQIFAAQGYTQEEATAALERAQAEVQRSLVTRARSRTVSAAARTVQQAQQAGVLDAAAAAGQLALLGYPVEMARGVASATEVGVQVGLVKRATGRIRSAYLDGEVTTVYARSALGQLGLVPGTIERTLTTWEVENTPNRKRRTAAQITADVAEGQLDTAEALARLANLGYEDADRRLFLADAQRKIVRREAQLVSAQVGERRTAARTLQRQIKEAQAQTTRAQTRLKQLTPLSSLKKWVASGQISAGTFFARLRAMGYDTESSRQHYLEACDRKNAVCAPEPPAEAGTPGGTGPGSGNGPPAG